MTTIKLKDTPKVGETLYKSGQFFKDTDGYIYVICEESLSKLSMVCVKDVECFKVKGEKITFKDSEATIDFLSTNINENLTPISVTISED